MTAANAFQETFINRGANALFFLGKTIRFTMATVFLLLLRENIAHIGGYSADMMIVFYITYQTIDTLAQVFYRGVYEFGNTIRTGTFDGVLTKPINALFNVMTGSPDINDVVFLVFSTGLSIYLLLTSNLNITSTSVFVYLFLLLNSFVITTAIHFFILCITMLTTDVDNVIFMYRDISKLAQFPVTLYGQPLRLALFFVVPVGLMVTVPAQVLLNVPPTVTVFATTLIGWSFLGLSFYAWNWSLKRYSSASS